MDTRSVQNSASTTALSTANADSTDKAKRAKKVASEQASLEAQLPQGAKADVKVDISPRSMAMSDSYKKALDIAKSTPDVREDKVAAIKKQLQEGTYKVDSGKVADGMMREALLDHLANSGS